MSSLIFWAPYLTHKAIVGHKRDKKRQQNYERWEGLRDEYDDMKRVTNQRQSIEYQPTGLAGQQMYQEDPSQHYNLPRHSLSSDRDLFTLRDQQEAGDARTAWTPQERWQSRPGEAVASVERLQPQRTSQQGPIMRQKTGATWDEGLPAPLRVSRRNFSDNGAFMEEAAGSSANSSRQDVTRMGSSGRRSVSREDEERRRKEEEVHVVESPYEWWK